MSEFILESADVLAQVVVFLFERGVLLVEVSDDVVEPVKLVCEECEPMVISRLLLLVLQQFFP